MDFIDSFLNRNTMYRLTLACLASLAALSIVFAFVGWLSYSALDLTLSLVVLLFACFAFNRLGALLTKATPTPESASITALILFFILAPLQSTTDVALLILAAAIAMLSKYILAINKKHLFNPAAFAAFTLSIFGIGTAIWWIATPVLLPFVAIIGFLFVRKLRRAKMFWIFLGSATVVFLIRNYFAGTVPSIAFLQLLESYPIIFFGTIMLTEPQTTPPLEKDRTIYGIIAGVLFSLSFNVGPLFSTPEFALLVANIYSYAVSMRRRIILSFHSVKQLSREVYEYAFTTDAKLAFEPGQYMEWTLAQKKPDTRGIRRYFTIASSPNDPLLRLGVRVPVEGSTFKDALKELKRGSILSATGVAGGFVLPNDPNQKIAAVAGGIGITPFMSMFRYLAGTGQRRDIVLIYAAATPLDFAYQEELESLKDSIGLTILYLPTGMTELSGWTGPSGYLTDALIKQEIRDYAKRHWYLSGPQAMVTSYKDLVRALAVPHTAIKTDYFPGF